MRQAGKGTSSAREQQRSCHESTRGGIQGGATLGPCRHVSLTQKSWRAAPRKLETEEEVSNSTKKYRPCCRCRWSPYTASSGGVTAALGAAFRPRYGGAAPTVAATRMQRGQGARVGGEEARLAQVAGTRMRNEASSDGSIGGLGPCCICSGLSAALCARSVAAARVAAKGRFKLVVVSSKKIVQSGRLSMFDG